MSSIDSMKTKISVADPEKMDPRLSFMIREARSALENRKHSYVLALSADWVDRFPWHSGVRLLLWDARIAGKTDIPNHSSFRMRMAEFFKALMLPGVRMTKANPARAMSLADRVLALEPHNRRALIITLEASRALGWLETALMACDKLIECRDHRPQDVVTAADLNLELGRTAEAVRLCESGMLRFPGDPSIRSALRRASVRRSMCSTVRVRNVPTVGG